MKKYDFNRGWTVRKAEAGFFPQDLAGEPVILPHDAMIWEKRSPDSPTESAGGWYPGGDYEYRKTWYVGEAGVGIVTYDMPVTFAKPYPAYLAYCGDFDITGYRRPLSYFREIVFGQRKDPYLAVRLPEHYGQKAAHTPWAAPECVASWTWNGYEGRHCLVEVYADAPQVELFVNGTFLRQEAGRGGEPLLRRIRCGV